jgi:hypothetical protein
MMLGTAPAAATPRGLFHALEAYMVGRIARLLVAVLQLIVGPRAVPAAADTAPETKSVIPAKAGIPLLTSCPASPASGRHKGSGIPAFAGMTKKSARRGRGPASTPPSAWSSAVRYHSPAETAGLAPPLKRSPRACQESFFSIF